MTRPKLSKVERAAIRWWRSYRPEHFTESDHLRRPDLDLAANRVDRSLARAVAELLKARKGKKR